MSIRALVRITALAFGALCQVVAAAAQTRGGQAPAGPGGGCTASVNAPPRIDAHAMGRPIDLHDSLWIEDLTMLEVRALRADRAGHEQMQGLPDADDISAIIATVTTDGIRMPECVKAGKFVINGVPLAPIEKTIANGRRIVEFPTKATVAAIRTSMSK